MEEIKVESNKKEIENIHKEREKEFEARDKLRFIQAKSAQGKLPFLENGNNSLDPRTNNWVKTPSQKKNVTGIYCSKPGAKSVQRSFTNSVRNLSLNERKKAHKNDSHTPDCVQINDTSSINEEIEEKLGNDDEKPQESIDLSGLSLPAVRNAFMENDNKI